MQSELPDAAWERTRATFHRVERARQRGWFYAATAAARTAQFELVELQLQLSHLDKAVISGNAQVQSVNDIFRDLASLASEFDDVRCDLRGRVLSVWTEPIVLDDLELGPFEIRLRWSELPAWNCFVVVAVAPNRAAVNDSVTHPHVQDDQLCLGEGALPIRRALEQGRLADFFQIAANLLRTYNRSSPYVSIDAWYGTRCDDCGASVHEDDRCTCNRCDSELCDGCSRSCAGCCEGFCASCISMCSACEDELCASCLTKCNECEESVCDNCIADGVCESCRERATEETINEVDNTSDVHSISEGADADAAV